MSSSGKPFMTITLEDGTFGVVRTDPRKPQFLEVIAIFSDISRARSCAEKENGWSGEQVIALPEAQPTEVMPELSPRQRAVLEAHRAKKNGSQLVEEKDGL